MTYDLLGCAIGLAIVLALKHIEVKGYEDNRGFGTPQPPRRTDHTH
jgi:hypothetical protein